jgi:hypothetical protein
MPYNKDTAAAAGRKGSRKGKPNKTTSELKAIVLAVTNEHADQLNEALHELRMTDVKAYVMAIERLLNYTLPKAIPAAEQDKPQATWPSKIVFQTTPDVELTEGQRQGIWSTNPSN